MDAKKRQEVVKWAREVNLVRVGYAPADVQLAMGILEMDAELNAREWQPIDTAPKDEEVLIGAWIDGEFKWGKSTHCYERGNDLEGEPGNYQFWTIDDCIESIAELPTHWQPLPAPPAAGKVESRLFWVIERGSPTEYFVDRSDDGCVAWWSADIARAKQYKSVVDVSHKLDIENKFFLEDGEPLARACEHIICSGPEPHPKPPAATKRVEEAERLNVIYKTFYVTRTAYEAVKSRLREIEASVELPDTPISGIDNQEYGRALRNLLLNVCDKLRQETADAKRYRILRENGPLCGSQLANGVCQYRFQKHLSELDAELDEAIKQKAMADSELKKDMME